eukprot:GILJ01000192.1.p1 GENE.GILJ01000192.1~~GILJ01000192.1.p1  ORF type:complete len:587 (-),score=88.72 GILJ01000192.1:163-1842(-)
MVTRRAWFKCALLVCLVSLHSVAEAVNSGQSFRPPLSSDIESTSRQTNQAPLPLEHEELHVSEEDNPPQVLLQVENSPVQAQNSAQAAPEKTTESAVPGNKKKTAERYKPHSQGTYKPRSGWTAQSLVDAGIEPTIALQLSSRQRTGAKASAHGVLDTLKNGAKAVGKGLATAAGAVGGALLGGAMMGMMAPGVPPYPVGYNENDACVMCQYVIQKMEDMIGLARDKYGHGIRKAFLGSQWGLNKATSSVAPQGFASFLQQSETDTDVNMGFNNFMELPADMSPNPDYYGLDPAMMNQYMNPYMNQIEQQFNGQISPAGYGYAMNGVMPDPMPTNPSGADSAMNFKSESQQQQQAKPNANVPMDAFRFTEAGSKSGSHLGSGSKGVGAAMLGGAVAGGLMGAAAGGMGGMGMGMGMGMMGGMGMGMGMGMMPGMMGMMSQNMLMTRRGRGRPNHINPNDFNTAFDEVDEAMTAVCDNTVPDSFAIYCDRMLGMEDIIVKRYLYEDYPDEICQALQMCRGPYGGAFGGMNSPMGMGGFGAGMGAMAGMAAGSMLGSALSH